MEELQPAAQTTSSLCDTGLDMLGFAGLLQQSNASNATYLFQPDKLNREYDLGDKTIQCGRRADAFKLWLAWKVHSASVVMLS